MTMRFTTLLSKAFISSVAVAAFMVATPVMAKKKPSVEIYPYGAPVSGGWVQSLPETMKNPNGTHAQDAVNTPNKAYEIFTIHADQAINALISRDEEAFVNMVSPNMVNHFGYSKLKDNVISVLIPFFNNFKQFDSDLTIAPTRDAWGNEGYSFYQRFITKSGETKPFLIQLVEENGSIVVANLTPDVVSPYK